MGQLAQRTLEELQTELHERALAREAVLVTGIRDDGRHVAAFVRLHSNGIGRSGVVLVHACGGDVHIALECLLAEDAERPSVHR
jgi:hypothetical protein